jgi:serine/threonine protein kinase
MFTILTGQFPYRGATDEELYDKICRAAYHIPSEVDQSMSLEAKDLISRLFLLKAEDRPTAKQIL